jgi:hypothetical protein
MCIAFFFPPKPKRPIAESITKKRRSLRLRLFFVCTEQRLCASEHLHDSEKDDRTEDCNQEAVYIEAAYAAVSEHAHDPAADKRADDADDDIKQKTLIALNDHRSDPSGNSTKYNPKKYSHTSVLR